MRRITKAKIKFISLVPAGATKIEPVYKSDGSFTVGTLIKADQLEEKGELLAVVYAPNHRDSQGDIAEPEVVKQMAYDFIAHGANIDINHDEKPVTSDRARVAETFLVQKTDTRFHGWKDRDGNAVDLEGAWATVIKIDDPSLRKKFKDGEWAGVSMGGTATVVQEKSDDAVKQLVGLLTKALSPNTQPEPQTDMTPQELEAITKALKDGFTSLTADLTKALKQEKPEGDKPAPVKKTETDDTPKFTGNQDDDRAVELHARKVELHNLKKSVDWADPTSIRSYKEQVSVLKTEWKEADDEAGIEQEPVKPVRKAGPSGGESKDQPAPGFHIVGVNKGDVDAFSAGAALAEAKEKGRKAQ